MKRTRQTSSLIDRLDDGRLQPILALRDRAARDRGRRFYVEGIRFVARAESHGAAISLLVAAPSLISNPLAQQIVERHRRAGRPILPVTAEVFRALGHGAEPQGIGAVVRQRWADLSTLGGSMGRYLVAISTIRSPGNLGTIMRTCEAAGVNLILLGNDIDPFDPRCVRASMGSLFAQRLVRTSLRRLAAWTARQGGTIVGTSPNGAIDFHQLDAPAPLVLLMGGERKGLSVDELAHCQAVVRIPMHGDADSLNVAVATGIVLFELVARSGASEDSASPPPLTSHHMVLR